MTATWPDAGDLRIEVSRSLEADVHIVTVQGAIDRSSVDGFKRVLSETAAGASRRIIVNCRGTNFINSGGMGALYACHCTCRDGGGGMVLCGAGGKFLELISTIGLDRVLLQTASEDEARTLLDATTPSEPIN